MDFGAVSADGCEEGRWPLENAAQQRLLSFWADVWFLAFAQSHIGKGGKCFRSCRGPYLRDQKIPTVVEAL